MRDLRCKRLELDEIWGYVAMKQKPAGQYPERKQEIGDFYCFIALDATSKLIPCYRVGKRTWSECDAFIQDLRSRLTRRVQFSTDAFAGYYGSIARAFDRTVDYAQIQKVFASDTNWGRYSPPVLIKALKDRIIGVPDMDLVSTSYVERQNLTVRMPDAQNDPINERFAKK